MFQPIQSLRRRFLAAGSLATVLALSAVTLVAPATTQAAYPEKPITIVVPYSPGSASDTTA